jgi:hypothetical protein
MISLEIEPGLIVPGQRTMAGTRHPPSQLDLLEVAVAVAQDDGEQVQQWMAEQQLNRPTADQAEAWRTETGERFTTVIVQPHVLAQRDDGAPSGG